ncbi:hypothetical protein pb186bvf_017969 [Paramecium bursaria]
MIIFVKKQASKLNCFRFIKIFFNNFIQSNFHGFQSLKFLTNIQQFSNNLSLYQQ